jgi:hypothetical protein
MEELANFAGKPGEPVPQVDPDDLKTVFEFVREAAKDHPVGGIGFSAKIFKGILKPGADVGAICYRRMMLHGLVSIAPEHLALWMKDGQLDDIVFREAAQIPMEFIGAGVERQGWPFDVDELLRRIGDATA